MKKICCVMAALLVSFTMMATMVSAVTVPGAVYSDQQAAGANKPVTQIQQELQQAGITDVKPTDWYAGSITVVVQAGLLAPEADGEFHPEAALTSGDGVAVFAKVLGIASKDDSAEEALEKAKDAGIVSQTTQADTEMTRLDVARLLATALGIEAKPVRTTIGYPFDDFTSVSPQDRGILKALHDLGIFKGYLENGVRTFRADNVLTRAEIALLVDRILGAQ